MLNKILAVADQTDQGELNLVLAARDSAMASYQAKPGKQTREDYEAARDMFAEALGRLTAKYFPTEAPAPEGERFKNRIQAWNWLQAQSYKISRGKFFNDCKAGFPEVHRDGTVSRFQVMQYAQQQDVSRRSAPLDRTEERERLEIEKLRLAVEKMEKENRKEDERWLLKEDAWAALAAVVGALHDSLRHYFHTGQGHLIYLASGDQTRGPELYEGAEELIGKAFNELARNNIIEGIFAVREEST